jgi:maltooligosyltrehalose trehalohydrolase
VSPARRIDYAGSVHDEREIEAVVAVLRGGATALRIGRNVRAFEARVAELFGKRRGIMCNSGSSALYLAVELLGLQHGDEVITSAVTFSSDVAPLVRAGLVAAVVVVGPETVNVVVAGSDTVRRTILESAVRWIEDFHVDGLRVDAIHAIYDPTARPVLEQLTAAVHAAGAAAGRAVLVIAESSDNDPRVVRPPDVGGLGFDAVWDDDLHHSLRVAITGDRRGYYVDYGGVADLAAVLAHRWRFTGRWSAYRGRTHGRPADDVPPQRFVVFTSNHDHVGNTPAGARPPFDDRQRLLAAATVLLSPFTPMLFMGEEHADPAPFPYFVGHDDEELLAATRAGRRREFRDEWTEEIADPGDPATFRRAVIDPSLAADEPHGRVLAAYTALLAARRRHAVLRSDAEQHVADHGDAIVLQRRRGDARAVVVLAFGEGTTTVPVEGLPDLTVALDTATWLPTAAPVVLGADGVVVDGPGAVLLVSS